MRVLVADDSAIYRFQLERILTSWGYQIVLAEDGDQAWDILHRDDAPRLVILDWIMPGMEGVQICQKVRERNSDFYTYILLLTAKTEKQDILEGLHSGADDYLTKPFNPNELELRLRAGKRIIELQDYLIDVQETLRESEERYRSLMRNIPIGVFRNARQADGHFRCIAANPSIAKMFRFDSIEDFLQCPVEDLFAIKTDITRFIHQLTEKDYVTNAQFSMKRNDGTVFWASISGQVIRNEEGEFLFTDGTVEDISHRIYLEEQLRQSQKMETVGLLASGIAHDFNNVLMSIKINSEFVLHALNQEDPIRRDVEEIRKSAQRASTLTSKLLSFGQKQNPLFETLCLKQVVESMEERIRSELGEKIQLLLDIDPDAGLVKTESTQIEQAILNMTTNAREAMPNGGQFTIRLHNQDPVPNENHSAISNVVLSLSDTGCGMDQETQSHIFEPFYTTKEKGNEGGLGLNTVYGIVKQSGGHIEVYSEPGRGTTFQIYLPRSK